MPATVFEDPTYGAATDALLSDVKPASRARVTQQPPLETAALEARQDETSQPPRQRSPLSPAAAGSLPDAESSHDPGRECESARFEEEIDNDKTMKGLRIDPNASDSMKDNFKLLLVGHYVKRERPDTPEVQEKLSLKLKKIKTFKFSCVSRSVIEESHLNTILKDLSERGIIRKSNSEYISPIDLPMIEGTYCLQINYDQLNEYIDSDKYPLPAIDKQLIVLGDKKRIFSMIEFKDVHYNIEINEEFMKYTSFMTPFGQYEYTRMPLGLKIWPAQFQRYMHAVMSELIDSADVIVTPNGILVATETAEGHLQILKRVFERVVSNKITIALDKSEFLCTEIEYFNYLISSDGVRPSTKELEPIRQFPIPKNYKELNYFMNLCKYFKKFIEGFELIAEPLNEVQKNPKFLFGERQIAAFETLKAKLISAPTLAIFTLDDETELHCDASSCGFGAVLLQRKDDNEMHPIFYFSRCISPNEKDYGSDQLERCAVGHAVKRFITYLRGIEFKIVTDADSVRRALKRNKPDFKTDGWIRKLLSPLNYVVEHRPRKQMEHVDALSRPTDST